MGDDAPEVLRKAHAVPFGVMWQQKPVLKLVRCHRAILWYGRQKSKRTSRSLVWWRNTPAHQMPICCLGITLMKDAKVLSVDVSMARQHVT